MPASCVQKEREAEDVMVEVRCIPFKEFVVLQRGFDLTKKDMRDGLYPVIGSTSIIGHHDEYKVEPPGVITGRSGSLSFGFRGMRR